MHGEFHIAAACSPAPPAASATDSPPRVLNGRQAESPSLRPRTPGEPPAYELKFLLDEQLAREIEARLAPRLTVDPHAEPDLENAYRITTLYCDTPELEVYHRLGAGRRRKYRLRRYGDDPHVYLERKVKHGEQVRKRRTAVSEPELALLAEFSSAGDWQGNWFHRQLVRRRLNPVCAVSYIRTAYVGTLPEGPVRLTFDRAIRCAAAGDWTPAPPDEGREILSDWVICEFKFRGMLPPLFKQVISDLHLTPAGISKYRHALAAARPPEIRGASDA